ncbi:MAG: AAA family ATPase, partial [Pseudomonadales bacterium]
METLQQLCFGPFRFDPVNQCLWKGEQMIDLAPKPFAVLSYLVTHPGRLLTKEELLQAVWPDVYVTDAVLKVCVREVRKALVEQTQAPQFIETLHRRGYRFIATVTPVLESANGATVKQKQPPQRANALVGRDKVVAQLHEHLQRAQQGTRQLVFVTGEAGMGKTAIVDTFLGQVNSQPQVLTASGQCVEHYGTGEAYLPVLQALSRLCRQAGAEQVPELLRRYAPTWLAQLPWLIEESEQAPLQHEILGTTRARMMREMGELCEALTRQVPLLLVLEDLHWSDYATLDLLAWLAQQREPARLLMLGTYRPVELIVHDHPLKTVKQELELHRQCMELPLDFLNNAEVAEFLQRRFPGHAFPDQLARVIYRRTDGNPLFLVNVVDYLRSRGMLAEHTDGWHLTVELAEVQEAVPESLQLMIDKQLDRLAPEEQQVLAGASIAGAEFTVAAVAAGLTQDIGRVEEYCEKLAQTQQFFLPLGANELPDGTVTECYSFIHTLYQDVLWRRLPATRRAQLHRAIGVWKESAYAERSVEIAAELAIHFEQGRELQRAIDYLRQAVRNARARYANRAALGYIMRALQLLDRLAAEEQMPLRLQLLEECGHIRRSMADMPGAAEDFNKSLACARETGQVDWEITALLHLATVMSWIDRERCLAVVADINSHCEGMEDSL